MTHEEAQELLAGFALNALEPSEASELAQHLVGCRACQAELQSLQTTVDRLADAPARQPAPPGLRSRILASAQGVRDGADSTPTSVLRFRQPVGSERRNGSWQWVRSLEWLAAAALISALSYTTVTNISTNRQTQATVARDDAALALLTSTETTNNQLASVPGVNLPQDAHGHWFHRPGVMTQVIVAEFLPRPASGQHYEVWLVSPSGWTPAGQLDVDANGYGRVIVLGSDGSGITSVEVTLEQGRPAQASGAVLLRYP